MAAGASSLNPATGRPRHPLSFPTALQLRALGYNDTLSAVVAARIMANITGQHCEKTILSGHNRVINHVTIHDRHIYTSSEDGSIKCWDLDLGKLKWSYQPTPRVRWTGKVGISESGEIVCAGLADREGGAMNYDPSIHILSKDGKLKASIVEQPAICAPCLDVRRVVVLGNRIFAKQSLSHDQRIKAWDLEGHPLDDIPSPDRDATFKAFRAHGNKLVTVDQKFLSIFDLDSKTEVRFKPKLSLGGKGLRITRTFIDGSRIVCGFGRPASVTCCVVDLETGRLLHHYLAFGAFLHRGYDFYAKCFYETEDGYVTAIALRKEWAYVGDSSGIVLAINLAEEKHTTLGRHQSDVFYLAIDGDVLVTGSDCRKGIPAEIKIWNVVNCTLLQSMEHPSVMGLTFQDGRLFASIEHSLVVWNYLNFQQGEKLTIGSAPEIERAVHTDDCSIQ